MRRTAPSTDKVIPSAPNYVATDRGLIYPRRKIRGFQFKVNTFEANGYVGCRLNGRRYLVHRAVAEAFIGPCPKGKQVNHMNCIKTDNRPANLEYVTPLENVRHYWKTIKKKRCTGVGKVAA